jgi:Raf kinase inhibitor-like YbhB/YbcL family protein
MRRIIFYLLLTTILFSACAPSAPATSEQPITDPLGMEDAMSIQITSSAFAQGEPIPAKYTCTGSGNEKDISPPLAWGEPPAGTQSFALIMDDPDAPVGTWDHWILFNIPASTRSLPESMPINSGFPGGNNSWGRTGYGGPCPPSGMHRYFFKLYALDEMLAISEGATKGELEKAMVGHILAQGELMGTFSK